ncbi:11648_t:CDS:2 [Cetraspora pellucida]|uniref:11648_t:CDS:1 n=1 Tax=Cetraspora pellucida TaxID=1433469 RepID=A0ACA9LAZ3_9GLOM|nr:11648_t:CDS:2 [Cetraspora pellucida]
MFSDNENLLDYQDNENSLTSSSTKQSSKSLTPTNVESKRIKLENNATICKIIISYKKSEKECGYKYKYDSETGNMSYHLRTKHKLIEKNESTSKSQQLQIDNMLSKVISHKSEKQNKLWHSISK